MGFVKGAIVVLALTALRPGCPPQEPAPSPEPTAPPVSHEPVCSPPELVTSCWHQPPGEDWQFIPAPAPTPTPAPTPVGSCAPVLDPAFSAPPNDDGLWQAATDQTTTTGFKQSVWTAVELAKASCSDAWNGDCMKAGPSSIDQGYLLIAKQLQLAGFSASQARASSGGLADHLWVRRAPGSKDWNATKLFSYGNGCLITGDGAFTVHGWYAFVGSNPTPPPVDPTPPPNGGGCTAPLPPKVWTASTLPPGWGDNEIGNPRWQMNCGMHPNGRVVDCTSVVAPRACEYCDSIGMGTYADGQLRCGCPVRNECKPEGETPQNFKCEERRACEAYLTGGTKLQTCAEAKAVDPSIGCTSSGMACSFAGDNPFQFEPSGGNCRLCSVQDPRVCGEWF